MTAKVSTQIDAEVEKCLKTFNCPQCNECFRYRRHFDKHVEGHKQNNCKYCGKLFTVRKKLVTHLHDDHKIALKASKHSCQYCDRSFVKKVSLYQHYQLHAAGKHVCLYCGLFFSEVNEFTKHQEKHTYEKPYKCEKCGEKFSRRQQYLSHVEGHEKYKCLTCGEGFSAQFKLTEHKRKGHEIEELEATHVCKKCQRSFHLQRALVLHQRVHKGEESFSCVDCGKNFSSRKFHSKHLKSSAHGGKKEKQLTKLGIFICDICGKICKEKHALSLHVTRVHSKEEPKKCSFCDYKSTSKANLKRHMEFHTEDRKFICECCGASFYMLCTLKEHRLYVHSEERNFQCSECGKSFKRRCGLNRHMLNHSGSRPYKCHCGQTYKRMSHLKRHKESSHGLVSQHSKLCRLRCDESGDFVPVVDEEGDIVTRGNAPKNMTIVSQSVTMNENGGEIDLQVISRNSYSVEGAKLVLSGKQGGESVSCTITPEFQMEMNVSSPSSISEQSDELKSMKEIQYLVPDNSFMSQITTRTLSQFESVISAGDFLSPNALSGISVNSSSKENSDSSLNTYENVVSISHDQAVSDSSHTKLVHLIQESPSNVPLIDIFQVVTQGNAVADDTMVLLCLSTSSVAATGGQCQ